MSTITDHPTVDPVTFEIIRNKLYQVMEEGIDALRMVSGSPTTNEGHDLMVSLYRADGSLMIGGVGFLHHLTSAAQAVKHIIANFSDDPGIDEGDVYMLNDSYTAALHPPDIYIISPVHWKGELRGFVSNFVHATDIGAVDPGGFSPNARDSYQEGFVTKGLKIIERGKPRRDVIETYLNQVRDPGLVHLDLKSQLAANHAAIERLHEMYGEYGPDTVDAVSGRLIEQSEELLRRRLRELPDGVWRTVQYVDWPDKLHRIELTMTKEDDELAFDFTGTGEQSELGVNNSFWATWGAIFAPIFPLLAWDMTWNEGLTYPVKMTAPEGTLVNCTRPAPISVATVAMVKVVNDITSLLIGRMLDASSAYADRAMAVWDGAHSAISMVGTDDNDDFFIAYSTDAFAGAGGAHANQDGVDIGGEIPNGVSRWANAETHELGAPLLMLYRRAVVDSGGPGKYRGGVTHEFAFAPHHAAADGWRLIVMTMGLGTPLSMGISGGLPGCHTGSTIFHNANVADMPEGFESTTGDPEDVMWGEFVLAPGEIFYHRFQGGGGYGDPLDRAEEAVETDVRAKLVSVEAARDIYGVVLDADGRVDPAATRDQRLALRSERLGEDLDAAPAERRDVTPSARSISAYLQIDDDGRTQCTWCGTVVADAGVHWKDAAVRFDRSTSAGGRFRAGVAGLRMRQYVCPSCATLFDTEIALEDDPPIYDEVRAWPGERS